MELREALAQISEIRDHLARTETFDGYRSATAAFSGSLALAAAVIQSIWIPDAAAELDAYLSLWLCVALVSALTAALEIVIRCRRNASERSARLSRMAVEQFLPSLAVGGLLTAAIAWTAPEAAWLLPGLWSVLFGLGLFSSARLLPRPVCGVGVHYIVTGIVCVAAAKRIGSLSPWLMVMTFGVGQLLAAAILYWTLERRHGQE